MIAESGVSHTNLTGAAAVSTNKILCCMCAVPIDPNPANTCLECLRSRVDITDGIQKQITMHQCRSCERYQRPPWVSCEWESRELLALCLKKVNGLAKVKLVDAAFVWTEMHSKRIKLKLTVQKEVYNVILQQEFVVEFHVHNMCCDDCHRLAADQNWRAVVQVRQKVQHKRTFLFLEQLILKHDAHKLTVQIQNAPDGLDFFFAERSYALKFVDFLNSVVPCRTKTSKQLVSADLKSNLFNYKFTFSTEIVPICKDDLVCLPDKVARACGNIANWCLVTRVNTSLHVVDPRTMQKAEINADRYWQTPFLAVSSAKHLKEFTVLDATPVAAPAAGASRGGGGGDLTGGQLQRRIKYKSKKTREREARKKRQALGMSPNFVAGQVVGAGAGDDPMAPAAAASAANAAAAAAAAAAESGAAARQSRRARRWALGDVEVARSNDLGLNDVRFLSRAHLGRLLGAGDCAMGYDLTAAVYNDTDITEKMFRQMPEVVLVKKHYPKWRQEISRVGGRHWQLAELEINEESTGIAATKGAARKAKRGKGAKGTRAPKVAGGGGDPALAGGPKGIANDADREQFLQDIEEDYDMRDQVNLYRNDKYDALAARAASTAVTNAVGQGGAARAGGAGAGGAGTGAAAAAGGLAAGGLAAGALAGAGGFGVGAAAPAAAAASAAAAAAVVDEDAEPLEEDFPVIELDELLDSMTNMTIAPGAAAAAARAAAAAAAGDEGEAKVAPADEDAGL
eukprot:g1961.t1